MRRLPRLLAVSILLLGAAGAARATDIPITGLKLIVVDKTAAASKAKAVFVAKDPAVTKGAGTGLGQIEATLDIAYDAVSGIFAMPQGTNWLVNSPSVGKYVNNPAPTGGAVKVSVIKPTSLVKMVARSLGDASLDISSPPTGPVYVADTIVNGAETTRLCTQFTGCVHKLIAHDTGYKLICKGNSMGDPACTAVPPSRICFQDLGDGTILDTCTGLQWEQKTLGSGPYEYDLHDVDKAYVWSGVCSVTTSKRCQPSLAAETACKAQTDIAYWASGCEQCTGGEGTCFSTSFTTVWEWLDQVNAANYAGHNDWRLPSESGCNTCYTGDSCTGCDEHELETILLSSYPCASSPCIDYSIFGPTNYPYWSASTYATSPTLAWSVVFDNGLVVADDKTYPGFVRAVRGGS